METANMRVFKQNKLWRDKMVAKAESQGSIINWRRLDDSEFDQQLRIKLSEEVEEVQQAQSTQELIHEIGDVLEVLDALCALHQLDKDEIIALQFRKKAERGGFAERKFVDTAEHPHDSFLAEYCLKEKNKYPEVK